MKKVKKFYIRGFAIGTLVVFFIELVLILVDMFFSPVPFFPRTPTMENVAVIAVFALFIAAGIGGNLGLELAGEGFITIKNKKRRKEE